MKVNRPPIGRPPFAGAFTLVEVLMGISVMGVMFVSLYSGISFGYALTNTTRQEERATQIIAEKMEVVRLLNWNQVTNSAGYIPATFTDTYYAGNPTNTPSGPVIYSGTLVQSSRLERGAVTTKDASAKPEAAAKPAERQPLVSTTLICAAP